MGSRLFRFHPEAREEFRDAVRWYHARDRLVSSEFRVAVSTAIRAIADAPQRWPKYIHGTRRFVMRPFPFSVVYLDDPEFNKRGFVEAAYVATWTETEAAVEKLAIRVWMGTQK